MATDLASFGWQIRDNFNGLPYALAHIRTFGTQGYGLGQFQDNRCIAYSPDGSRIVVSDEGAYRIQAFGVEGDTIYPQLVYGAYSSTQVDGAFYMQTGVTFTPDGSRILVVDKYQGCVKVFGISGNVITPQNTYGTMGAADGQFAFPMGIAITPDGSRIIVTETSSNHRLQVFGLSGSTITHQFSYSAPGTGDGQLNNPTFVAVHPDGTRILVSDAGNYRLQLFQLNANSLTYLSKFGSSGTTTGKFGTPHGVAFTPDGARIVVGDGGANGRIQLLTLTGNVMAYRMSIGSQGAAYGQFDVPAGIAVSPDGVNIVVSDVGASRIVVV